MENKFKDIKPIKDIEGFYSSLYQDELELFWDERTLFHYTSGQVLKSIIDNKELWITKSEFLNDKDEIKYAIEVLFKIIDDFTDENPSVEEQVFKLWIKQSLETQNFTIDAYILSLSTNEDSNLLWSNYAENEGYNIGFNYKDLFCALTNNVETKYGKQLGIFPYLVIYDPKKHEELLRKEVINLYKIYLYAYNSDKDKENIYYKYSGKTLTNILIYSSFFKAKCFSQEEEFRMAILTMDNDIKKIKYECRLSNGVFIPYIKLPIIDESGNLPIKSITIGPKNNLDIAEDGLRYFLDMNGLDDVNINRSQIPYRY